MNCSFCKREIEAGTGSMLALRDGKILRFCSNKCRKNHRLGRSAESLKWVVKDKKKREVVSE